MRADEVFDSAKATKYSFAKRKLPDDHSNALLYPTFDDWLDVELGGSTGGYVVYGMSKTGKTSMVEESFMRLGKDPISLHGKDLSSVEQFWVLVAESLGIPASRELTEADSSSHSEEIGLQPPGAKVMTGSSRGRQKSDKETHGPLTSVAVQQALHNSGRPLFIDDFHHCPTGVATDISLELKPIVRNTLVVLIAIPSASFAPVRGTVDNGGRFKRIEISLWSEQELEEIGNAGFPHLGYGDVSAALSSLAAKECFGSPHIMQDLCQQIARFLQHKSIDYLAAVREISTVFPKILRMVADNGAPENFAALVSGRPSKGYSRKAYKFEKVVNGASKDSKFDNYGVALLALRELCRDYSTSFEVAEIAETLRGMEIRPSIDSQKVGRTAAYLARIAEEKKGNLDPMLVHVSEGSGEAKGRVEIVDPFLAFYLAHGAWIASAELDDSKIHSSDQFEDDLV